MPGVLNFLDNKLANIVRPALFGHRSLESETDNHRLQLPTLGCPDIKWNFDLFKVYPGYTHP